MDGCTKRLRGIVLGGLVVGGLFATGCATGGTVADGGVVRWVEKTVAERQPTPEDKRFDEIGWVTDISRRDQARGGTQSTNISLHRGRADQHRPVLRRLICNESGSALQQPYHFRCSTRVSFRSTSSMTSIRGKGSAPVEERNELQRIQHEGHAKKLSVGTVHAYVLTPDGHTYDSLHVAAATNARTTVAMSCGHRVLQAVARQANRTSDRPVVPPFHVRRHRSAPRVARRRPRLLGDIPAENWIVLTREEWLGILPGEDVAPG